MDSGPRIVDGVSLASCTKSVVGRTLDLMTSTDSMANETTRNAGIRDVVVVGGGLAGLSAACALAGSGYYVHLIERRPYVGGRASSYEHPGTGEVVDNCQHVLLGCCTNLIAFYKQLSVADQIRWFNRITFIEPGGRRSLLRPGLLPAPLHNAIAFLQSSALSPADKVAISRGMMSFLRGIPADGGDNFASWLARHGQTRRAIDRFWNPVLVSALNEHLDCVSVHYAAMVFRRSFMQSEQAGWMGVPTIPLSELYSHAVDFIESHGGQVSLRTSVDSFHYDEQNRRWRIGFEGGSVEADAVVLAVPFESMQKLYPLLPALGHGTSESMVERLGQFQHSPITGIHLWFDREITDLDHAVLLETTIQWMYNKTRLQPQRRAEDVGSYLELVVSASKTLVPMSRQEIIDLALRELGEFFPVVRQAKLVKAAVVKEVRATFSVTPGLDAYRPGPETAWPRIFLAGDWTATGWPSTMEGAVRSGNLAAEALTKAAGKSQKFLQPDLPPQGLMRLFR
ncbi:MAG TPA: hydroxysqualene dehydroxylase HpnE [Acidobacteriaceae bacterium]|nr:hydroxysqualene dehydroxylase HpnE [Acidobacteriaceae bacterium]